MESIRCRDLGFDCSFKAWGTTVPETMRTYIRHAESVHNLPVLSADALFLIAERIRK